MTDRTTSSLNTQISANALESKALNSAIARAFVASDVLRAPTVDNSVDAAKS